MFPCCDIAGYKQKCYLGWCEATQKSHAIHSYNPNSKRRLLCLNEKYEIPAYRGDKLLNKRTEIINTCRHRSKYKLANYDTIDWRQIHAIRYHYNASF